MGSPCTHFRRFKCLGVRSQSKMGVKHRLVKLFTCSLGAAVTYKLAALNERDNILLRSLSIKNTSLNGGKGESGTTAHMKGHQIYELKVRKWSFCNIELKCSWALQNCHSPSEGVQEGTTECDVKTTTYCLGRWHLVLTTTSNKRWFHPLPPTGCFPKWEPAAAPVTHLLLCP